MKRKIYEEKTLIGFMDIEEGKFKEDLILFIVDKAINEFNYEKISRLQIVKILFLLDKFFKEKTGKKISPYIYIKEKLGPYSSQIINDLTALVNEGILVNLENYYEYSLIKIPENRKKVINEINLLFSEEEFQIILKEIFELSKNLFELLKKVHEEKEVVKTKPGEIVKI